LKVQKEKRNNLSAEQEQKFSELNGLVGVTQYILNEKRQFHPSGKKTNTIRNGDPAVDRIKSILQTEIKEKPAWLCAPVFRDAIIFYDPNGQIVSALNICLSCQYLETKIFHQINGGYKTFDLFKSFFIDLGTKWRTPAIFSQTNLNR
jgi:hypothetical protein